MTMGEDHAQDYYTLPYHPLLQHFFSFCIYYIRTDPDKVIPEITMSILLPESLCLLHRNMVSPIPGCICRCWGCWEDHFVEQVFIRHVQCQIYGGYNGR